jgi:hypothetical protein
MMMRVGDEYLREHLLEYLYSRTSVRPAKSKPISFRQADVAGM